MTENTSINCDKSSKETNPESNTIQENSIHKCGDCKKSFSNKYHLLRHINTIHYSEWFDCPTCDQTYSRKDNLYRHIRDTCKGRGGYLVIGGNEMGPPLPQNIQSQTDKVTPSTSQASSVSTSRHTEETSTSAKIVTEGSAVNKTRLNMTTTTQGRPQGPDVSNPKITNQHLRKIRTQHNLFRLKHKIDKQAPHTPFKSIKLSSEPTIPTRIRTLPTPTIIKPRGQGTARTDQRLNSPREGHLLSNILDNLVLPPNITKQVTPTSEITSKMGTTPQSKPAELDILRQDLALLDSSSEDEAESELNTVVGKIKNNLDVARKTRFLDTHMNPKKVTHRPRQNQSRKEATSTQAGPSKLQNKSPVLEVACSNLLLDLSQIMELKNKTDLVHLTPTLVRIHHELRDHLSKYGY